MRRFELRQGTSSKFWEIEVEGLRLTARFGRIGAQGQTQLQSFGSEEDARVAAERRISEKFANGYREAKVIAEKPSRAAPAKDGLAKRVVLKDRDGREVILALAGEAIVIGQGVD